MKAILYIAITANGMIAKKDNTTPWSKEELSSYFGKVKEIGAFVVGNKTLPLFWESDFVDMGNPLTIVLTRNKTLKNKDKIKYVNSAEDAFGVLEKAGFKTALITGGAETNKAFAKYIDEIYLDVEPFVFGQGIPLFSLQDFEYNLEFIESKMLSPQTIQLHYKVKK